MSLRFATGRPPTLGWMTVRRVAFLSSWPDLIRRFSDYRSGRIAAWRPISGEDGRVKLSHDGVLSCQKRSDEAASVTSNPT